VRLESSIVVAPQYWAIAVCIKIKETTIGSREKPTSGIPRKVREEARVLNVDKSVDEKFSRSMLFMYL